MKRQLGFVLLLTALLNCCGGASQSGMLSVAGRWAGVFQSNDLSLVPFTILATITEDSSGNLTAAASFLKFACMSAANLKGTLSGTTITLAGSDSIGDNVTFKGMSNSQGTQMSLRYVLNASASGKCETDSGSGMLTKQ